MLNKLKKSYNTYPFGLPKCVRVYSINQQDKFTVNGPKPIPFTSEDSGVRNPRTLKTNEKL